jgi:vanillate O-demethylase monooxygenase subunit
LNRGVRVTRWIMDSPPPPFFQKAGNFAPDQNVDRWQIIDFEPPCYVNIYVGGVATGTGVPEGNRVGGLGLWIMNAMTPLTDATSNYFWAVGRDFHTGNAQVTEFMRDEISRTFDEDAVILELQQSTMDLFSHPQSVDILADAGGVQSRRLLRSLIAEENALNNHRANSAAEAVA